MFIVHNRTVLLILRCAAVLIILRTVKFTKMSRGLEREPMLITFRKSTVLQNSTIESRFKLVYNVEVLG